MTTILGAIFFFGYLEVDVICSYGASIITI